MKLLVLDGNSILNRAFYGIKLLTVVKDPSKVLLKPDTLDKLATRSVTLETEEAARTLCVTINPVSAYGWRFDKDAFMAAMTAAVDAPVINVKEELR